MIEINGTIIAQVVNFLILMAILAKVAYKPLMQALEDRREKIAADIASAENDRAAADSLKKDYQRQLAEAQQKAQQMVDKAIKQAEGMKSEILAEAKAEQTRMLQNTAAEIAREQKKAIDDMKAEIAAMVMLSTEAILKRNVTSADNVQFVKDFVNKLEQGKVGGSYVN